MGCASLFVFCVSELKYSEASAYQKLQALKLMDEVPEAEEKLKLGALTLTTAAQVQSFAQRARKQGVSLRWNCGLDALLSLPSTPVRQVLINLLLNAVQASEPGGEVSVSITIVGATLAMVVVNG